MVRLGGDEEECQYFTFVRSLQGDVLGILGKTLDNAGVLRVDYLYDPWGRLLRSLTTAYDESAVILAELNPFRYRGYLYDEETGLYYLRTRYYNPTWGRFMNADSLLGKTGALLSHNIFAYCKNRPTMAVDYDGKDSAPHGGGWRGFLHQIFLEWIPAKYSEKYKTLATVEQSAVLRHPYAAFSVMGTDAEAERKTNALFGAGAHKRDGNWGNAFQHAYWNALMVKRIMSKSSLDAHHLYGSLVGMRAMDIAGEFSTAHELRYLGSFHKPQTLGNGDVSTIGQNTEMDLHNNAFGLRVGAENWFRSDAEIANIIWQQVMVQHASDQMNGELVIIADYD